MQVTLDDMIQFCASETNTDEDVAQSNGTYTGDALPIVKKYINAINYAKNMIIRQKYMPTHIEEFILDNNRRIDLATASKIFVKLVEIRDTTDSVISDYRQSEGLNIIFDSSNEGDVLSVQYAYKPDDFTLSNLSQVLDLPEGIVDWQILCYYACYKYHLIKGGDRDLDKTSFFLGLFNDGFSSIRSNFNSKKTVKTVYGVD